MRLCFELLLESFLLFPRTFGQDSLSFVPFALVGGSLESRLLLVVALAVL